MRVALTSGLSRKQVAADFGVGFSTLSRRIQLERKKVPAPTAQSNLEVEVSQLRKVNRLLREEYRVGQAVFSVHIRPSRKRTLASTTSFLMIAVMATFGGFPRLII
ncbi:MAG: hypothetical protein JKY41_14880 [Rhodobacteraceae bacterium]|nr:hypothetical protein [Paracoccaceae bacterium]